MGFGRRRGPHRKERSRIVAALRERDGDGCCFGTACIYQRPLDFATPPRDLPQHERVSIEHRVPWSRKQAYEIDDLALGHSLCNQRQGLAWWAYRSREGMLYRKVRGGHINAWPALTYAGELEFE